MALASVTSATRVVGYIPHRHHRCPEGKSRDSVGMEKKIHGLVVVFCHLTTQWCVHYNLPNICTPYIQSLFIKTPTQV